MSRLILVLNTGSATVKFSIFAFDEAVGLTLSRCGMVDGIGERLDFHVRDGAGEIVVQRAPSGGATHERALAVLLDWLQDDAAGAGLDAAGHRVVHGGTTFVKPVQIDQQILEQLETLVPLAPLHQPSNLAAIKALHQLAPTLPQVACFDTAFHHGMPEVARRFAIPRDLSDAGIVRYGFHGISYEYVAAVLPDYAGTIADGRVVVAHLGQGASMCAMRGRKSVATTMGLTALDGLVMGTRCGELDPGVVLQLMQDYELDSNGIEDLLYHRSGLLGVSGISGDMRMLLASPDPRAAEAVDLFVYRAVRALGSLAAAMGGLDALVFTGGIGENAAVIRERICRDSAWLGLRLDEAANAAGGPRIDSSDSVVAVWVVTTDEALMIARATCSVLTQARRTP